MSGRYDYWQASFFNKQDKLEQVFANVLRERKCSASQHCTQPCARKLFSRHLSSKPGSRSPTVQQVRDSRLSGIFTLGRISTLTESRRSARHWRILRFAGCHDADHIKWRTGLPRWNGEQQWALAAGPRGVQALMWPLECPVSLQPSPPAFIISVQCNDRATKMVHNDTWRHFNMRQDETACVRLQGIPEEKNMRERA